MTVFIEKHYLHLENLNVRLVSQHVLINESNLIIDCAFNDISTVYNYIKDLTQTKTNVTLDQTYVYNDTDIANLFNTYFHSVYTPSPVGAPNIDSLQLVSNTLSSISITEAQTLRYASRPGFGNFKQVQKLPNVETFGLENIPFWQLQGFASFGKFYHQMPYECTAFHI